MTDDGLADRPDPVLRAQLICDNRRHRRELFGNAFFDGPAWDILLELYVAEREGKAASLNRVCREAEVSAETGRRWVRALEGEGLVAKGNDEFRIGVELVQRTEKAQANLARYLHLCT